MNVLKYLLIYILALVLLLGAGYLYASSGIKSKPGFAQLYSPKGAGVDALVSVNLGPGGVGPIRWIFEQVAEQADHGSDEAEKIISSVLGELNGVQLRVYEVHGNQEFYDRAIDQAAAKLRSENWQVLVKVNEDEDHVLVMHTSSGDMIDGLAVLVSTPDNAVFVNLIGPFDPQSIAEAIEHSQA